MTEVTPTQADREAAQKIGSAMALGQLDCSANTVELAGSVQGNQSDFSFQWTTLDGSLAIKADPG